ncbi:MAG: HAMP domain-containing protein [Chloroflexota bacterium]
MSSDQIKSQQSTTKVQISIRWKILIGFTVLFTVVYILALGMFTNLAIAAADEQIKEDLTQVLYGAASEIDTEILLELAAEGAPNENGFSDDPRFIAFLDWLEAVHTAEPDAWPYLYIPHEDQGYIYFVVDLWARYDTTSAAGFMEAYRSNSGYIIAGLSDLTYREVNTDFVQTLKNQADDLEETQPWLSGTLNGFADWLVSSNLQPKREFGTYGDQFGKWASGYYPLTNHAGENVAAIGVDFQADMVNTVRNEVRSSVQRAFFIAYPVLLVLVFWFSSVFTRPLITLTAAAERVGEGDYEVEFSELISERNRDEIDILASVFASMVKKVYKREQKLKRQVAQLKIEIDEKKQASEVSQIVDTDFFKELQSRADNLRSKRDKK